MPIRGNCLSRSPVRETLELATRSDRAYVFAALTALGALVILATAVHQWTRSVVLAVLATAASVLVSLFGLFWLMLWTVSGAQFG